MVGGGRGRGDRRSPECPCLREKSRLGREEEEEEEEEVGIVARRIYIVDIIMNEITIKKNPPKRLRRVIV